MLYERVVLRFQYQAMLTSSLDDLERKRFWDEYCKSVSLTEHLKRKKDEKIPSLPPRAEPLVDVTHEMLSPERWDRILTWIIAMSGCRLLQINPWASHEVLKTKFEQWLLEFRKHNPPFKRRGPPVPILK
jgi:hypothetical protein